MPPRRADCPDSATWRLSSPLPIRRAGSAKLPPPPISARPSHSAADGCCWSILTHRVLKSLEESFEEFLFLNPRLEVLGILLSKFDGRLKEERQVADYLRRRWHVSVFSTEVGTNSKILEAGSAGTSVFHYAGADKA